MDGLQDKLIELERGFWDAAGGDGSYYEENFAKDGMMVLPFEGGMLNKAQTVGAVRQAEAWSAFEINKPQLLEIAENEVALLYEASGKRANGQDYRALISSLYRRRVGGWELVFHQQTPLA